MLVLSRKVGESFVIGDSITITVVRIVGGGVRIGIDAPADCSVMRSELQDLLDGAAGKGLSSEELAGDPGLDV